MGWKNVRDHYRIEHIVQVRDGRICIGSSYIHNILMVTFDGAVQWGTLGPVDNEDLRRYYAEMTADLVSLRRLVETPDTFARDLLVYTWKDGLILEKQCEEHGWPNVCHDGQLQYNNTHFADRAAAVKAAVASATAEVEAYERMLAEAEERILKCRGWVESKRRCLAAFKAKEAAL